MKRYGFTGTRNLDIFKEEQNRNILRVIEAVADGTEFTTGACMGVDAFLYKALKMRYPKAWHRVIVPWNRSRVVIPEPDENTEIIYMPEGTDYRDRNNRILDFTHVLYAVPFKELAKPYSGTWMTYNLALKRRIPAKVISLHNGYEIL